MEAAVSAYQIRTKVAVDASNQISTSQLEPLPRGESDDIESTLAKIYAIARARSRQIGAGHPLKTIVAHDKKLLEQQVILQP